MRKYIARRGSVEAVLWDGSNNKEVSEFLGEYLDGYVNFFSRSLTFKLKDGKESYYARRLDYIWKHGNEIQIPLEKKEFDKYYEIVE